MASLDVLGEGEEEKNAIKELITPIRSAFRAADFEKLEAELARREKEARRQLEEKTKRIELLEEARLHKISLEREVKELKEEILKVTQERDELGAKYRDVLKTQVELKEKVSELEVENVEAKTKLDLEMTRFKWLEDWVRRLEKDRDLLLENMGLQLVEEGKGETGKCRPDKRFCVKGVGAPVAGEVRDGDGVSGVVGGKNGVAVMEADVGGIRRNGIFPVNANGGDSAKGDGGLPGQAGKEPSSEPVNWICDSDDDCTPSGMQRTEGRRTALSAQSPPSLAAQEPSRLSGVKITCPQEAVGETGGRMLKRKGVLPNDGNKLMKVGQQPTTLFRNGESGTTSLQDGKLNCESRDDMSSSSSSSQDFPTVPFASIFLIEKKASEVSKKWPFQADLVAALQSDRSLCLQAICALYRRAWLGSSRGLSSRKRSFEKLDLSKIKALAEFLINGDKHWKPSRSVEQLSDHDPKGLDECRRLSIKYSRELFEMYRLQGDSLFSSEGLSSSKAIPVSATTIKSEQ